MGVAEGVKQSGIPPSAGLPAKQGTSLILFSALLSFPGKGTLLPTMLGLPREF